MEMGVRREKVHLVGVWQQGGTQHWISLIANTARRLQRCLGAKRSTVPFSFLTNKRRAGNGSLETMFETCGFPDVTFRRLDMINEKLTRTSKDPFPVPLFESQHRLSDPLKMGGVKRLKAREGQKWKFPGGKGWEENASAINGLCRIYCWGRVMFCSNTDEKPLLFRVIFNGNKWEG